MAKKYLDYDGLLYFWQKIKAKFNKADIAYDATNKKITKTIDGTTSDVVTAATLKTDMGLGSVAAGAEVNQNAFSNVKVGSTTVAADTKTDTLELVAGSNVTLTPDATNDKVTIAATDTTYSLVGANGTTGLVKNGSTVTSTSGLTACPIVSGVPYYKDTNTTYTAASATPLMDGTGAVGSSAKYAREDHVHPSDTAKADKTTTVDGVSLNGATAIHYGTCSTSGITAEKTVAISNFSLVTGARVIVKFTSTTAGYVNNGKLNVNSTGAKTIMYKGVDAGQQKIEFASGKVYEFVYDGTNWELVGEHHDLVGGNGTTGLVKNGSSVTSSSGYTACPIITGVPYYKDTTYTPASATPIMDGTGAVGTSAKYAREDHVHPSDTSRVPTTRKINGIALSEDVTLDGNDIAYSNEKTISERIDDLADNFVTKFTTHEGVQLVSDAHHYATCTTAAATAAKVATLADRYSGSSAFTLRVGARVFVKFTYVINVASATLDVHGTGARPIYYNGAALGKGLTDANGTYEFVYNGTQWELVGDLDSNTTYSTLTQALVNAGAETTGKLVTAKILRDSIDNAIEAAQVGAAMFQGTINANSTLTDLTDYKKGWYWVVATAGTYAGEVCEVGDMIFCISDKDSEFSNDDFSVVQNNLDMAAITNAEIDTILAA